MFSRFCKKTVLSFLIATLLFPSVLLLYPQKTEAQVTSCLSQIGAALGISAAAGMATRVPIDTDTVAKSGIAGSFVEDCIFKPLVVKLAKALLNNMTRDTIKWINGGFKGNPGFAVDLKGMLTDTADQVMGEFLAKEAPFLCSQFSFKLRIALAQTRLPYNKRSACTLTRILNNVNGFVDGNNRGSWDTWLQVTTVPQNNAYGAFRISQDELSKRILDAQDVQETYLNWGNGFKDWEFCETQAEATERQRQAGGNLGAELAVPECRKETPGSIVESRLSETLNMDLKQIGLANDLNAVYDALTNQLMKQIVDAAAGGILGGSRGPRQPTANPYMNYTTAAQPTTFSGGTNSIGGAFSSGLTSSLNEVNQQLVNPEPTIISPTTGAITGVMTYMPLASTEVASVSINPASTLVVNDSNPLVLETSLSTNFLSGGLVFRIAFKKTSTALDLPYLNVFSVVNADVTLYNGSTMTSTITTPGQATIVWADVGTDSGKPFTVKMIAPKRVGAAPGDYMFEIMVYDLNGKIVDMKQHKIIVQ